MLHYFIGVTSKQSNCQEGERGWGWKEWSWAPHPQGPYHPPLKLNTQDKLCMNEKQFLSDCDQCCVSRHAHQFAEIHRENYWLRLRENIAVGNDKPRYTKGPNFSLEVPWYSSQIHFILCVLKHFMFEKTIQIARK